jgi:hypothetical protein
MTRWACCGTKTIDMTTVPATAPVPLPSPTATVTPVVAAPAEAVVTVATPAAVIEVTEITHVTEVTAPEVVDTEVAEPANPFTRFSHYGRGVTGFVKPEQGLTRAETRHHVRKELRRWLTSDICVDATEIAFFEPPGSTVVAEGRWPAGRLYMLHCLLTEKWDYIPGGSILEEMRVVGNWATEICLKHLDGRLDKKSAAMDLAVGFVTTDLLSEKTVAGLWERTPFDPLREAAPLSDAEEQPLPESEDEDEEDEDEESEESESEESEEETEDEEESESEEEEDEDEDEVTLLRKSVKAHNLHIIRLTFLLATWVSMSSGVIIGYLMRN